MVSMYESMRGWDWLTRTHYSWGFFVRVIVKAGALFALLNVVFVITQPVPFIGRHFTVYNWLVPGRERFAYDQTADGVWLMSSQLDAMIASHTIRGRHDPNAFRVFLIGDSATWGVLLSPSETYSGQLNALDLTVNDQPVQAFNFAFPWAWVQKDVLILDNVRQFQPDMIVWLVTLDGFQVGNQWDHPLIQANLPAMRRVTGISPEPFSDDTRTGIVANSFVGQRVVLADMFRLQLFGFEWAFRGTDSHLYPYTPRANDLEADERWFDFTSENPFTADDLHFGTVQAGIDLVDVPVILVNEPIFIADGENSDIRYNAYYARWAYDRYREMLAQQAEDRGWTLIDLWDAIPPQHFTDTPMHIDPEGSAMLAGMLADAIRENAP
jgi:hypothetical protein